MNATAKAVVAATGLAIAGLAVSIARKDKKEVETLSLGECRVGQVLCPDYICRDSGNCE